MSAVPSQEQRAANELQQTLLNSLDGKTGKEVAILAFIQGQLSNAAVQGLIELLVHKGVINPTDLSGALRHAYNRANDKITHAESPLILPDSAVARPQ